LRLVVSIRSSAFCCCAAVQQEDLLTEIRAAPVDVTAGLTIVMEVVHSNLGRLASDKLDLPLRAAAAVVGLVDHQLSIDPAKNV
jgi:hypothetical protein